jgi:hypothetical protein
VVSTLIEGTMRRHFAWREDVSGLAHGSVLRTPYRRHRGFRRDSSSHLLLSVHSRCWRRRRRRLHRRHAADFDFNLYLIDMLLLLFIAAAAAGGGIALQMMMTLLERQPLLVRLAVNDNDGAVVVNRWVVVNGSVVGMSGGSDALAHFAAVIAALPATAHEDLSTPEYGRDAVRRPLRPQVGRDFEVHLTAGQVLGANYH